MRGEGCLEELWEKMGEEDPERLPYWTEIWPASIALAEFLQGRAAEMRGKACLDLGCGLGLTACIGQWLGAKTLAVDYEQAALHFCRMNSRLNNLEPPQTALMDWRTPAVAKNSLWRIWGGDIVYERSFWEPLLNFLKHGLAEAGCAWLAEPGRTGFEGFPDWAGNCGWKVEKACNQEVAGFYPGEGVHRVTVWEMSRLQSE